MSASPLPPPGAPLTLYFAPQTRSGRPRWLLEELGVPYELVRLDLAKAEQKSAAYLQIHPLGLVPALVDGDGSVFESVAICMHLADRFPDKNLAPPPGSPRRARYYQWIMFVSATVEPAVVGVFLNTRQLPPERRSEGALAQARQHLLLALRVLEDALREQEFLLGGQFSAADVVAGSVLIWAATLIELDAFPVLRAYIARLRERPAYARSRD